jgi:superfamily II DNA or RNA helicase
MLRQEMAASHDDIFEDLTEDERRMLEVLSVLYLPIPITTVITCLVRCKVGDRAWTTANLRPHLEKLVERGLLSVAQGRYRCTPRSLERATRLALGDGLFDAALKLIEVEKGRPQFGQPLPTLSWSGYASFETGVRDLRLAAYRHQGKRFLDCASALAYDPELLRRACIGLALDPFDAAWLDALPAEIVKLTTAWVLERPIDELSRPFVDWLVPRWLASPSDGEERYRTGIAFGLILDGRLEEARGLVAPCVSPGAGGLKAFLQAVTGDLEGAMKAFASATSEVRKIARRRTQTLSSEFGLVYPIVLIARGRNDDAAALVAAAANDQKLPLQGEYANLRRAVDLARGESVDAARLPGGDPKTLAALLRFAICCWAGQPDLQKPLEQAFRECDGKHRWLAAEYAEMLARATGAEKWRGKAASLHAALSTKTLLDAIPRVARWERMLEALDALQPDEQPTHATRLVWQVGLHANFVAITPKEQKRTRGGWTAGRPVALKRLHAEWKTMQGLSDADRRICACIEAWRAGYYGQVDYVLDWKKALPLLPGHPLLFDESDLGVRLEAAAARPVLHVAREGGSLVLRLDPPYQNDGIACSREGTLLRIVQFSDSDRNIARIIGAGCEIPGSAQARLSDTLARLAGSITVHADGLDAPLEEVEADPRLHVFLTPEGEGLRARFAVRPLGEAEYPPAAGPVTIMEKGVQARRDMHAEQAALDEFPGREFSLPHPADCLELLAALDGSPHVAAVHWPQGVRFRLARRLEWSDLRLRVKADRDWFTIGGDVPVDDERVLAIADLLARRQGRFVALGEGEFIALSRELERRLSDLDGLADVHGAEVRVHPLTAPLVQEALQIAGKGKWGAHLKRFAPGPDAALPPTLQAELRDYQVDGFRWLARLAGWGAGACLADDMGLGKTLQALALLVHRAPGGPALVVAPTSVCANWLAEARRFAPTLQLKLYAGTTRDLPRPGPFDVVVTSYALLVADEAPLTAIKWHTAVLDEGQAIKNASTARSRAALALQADFRLITSGTPLENHLGELWSLFRFLNPGLLGSREQFESRFVRPIERGDREERARLKRRVAPFILRRTKSQVLEELPPRTEITLRVELSEDERALYETLRRDALRSMEGGAPQRMRILAELMRLRRACCHPRLVSDGAPIGSSKLEVFTDVLDELLDNRHRALVFSQFVDHLAVVRERLDARGIAYQYLDGSTPMAERETRVAAFQRGEGDVFLISLRAGGTGLNLTAADYVIHLDPWWNPAVEDQASDRAHRIGQQRPVTIYRLVTANTVEERILDLHHRKRDLADSLLEDADAAARLSAEDLLALLAEA